MPDDDWFEVVSGPTLEQGDLINQCPIYAPVFPETAGAPVSEVDCSIYEVVVLSQSCDLVIDREKISHVVLCPIAARSSLRADHPLFSKGRLDNAAKNKEPAFFVLDGFDHPRLSREISVVHFRQVYTLPMGYLRKLAEARGERLRLRSPYKEALSSRFAGFFGRVALPKDVKI